VHSAAFFLAKGSEGNGKPYESSGGIKEGMETKTADEWRRMLDPNAKFSGIIDILAELCRLFHNQDYLSSCLADVGNRGRLRALC
jgi:hypothetical protein